MAMKTTGVKNLGLLFFAAATLVFGFLFEPSEAQASLACWQAQAQSHAPKFEARIPKQHLSWLQSIVQQSIAVAENKSWLTKETRQALPGFDVLVAEETPGKEIPQAVCYFDPLAQVSYIRLGSSFEHKDHETVTAHEIGHLIFQSLAKGHLNQFQAVNEFLADYFNWQVTGKEYINDMVQAKRHLRTFSLESKPGSSKDLRGDNFATVPEFLLRKRGSSFSEEYAASLFLTVGFIDMKKDPALSAHIDADLKLAVEEFGNFIRQGGELSRWIRSNELWNTFGQAYAPRQGIPQDRMKGLIDTHLFLQIFLDVVPAERRDLVLRHFQKYDFRAEALDITAKWIQRVRQNVVLDPLLKNVRQLVSRLDSVDPLIETREQAQQIVDLFTKEGHSVEMQWENHSLAVEGYADFSRGRGISIVMAPKRLTRLGLIATILHEVGHMKRGASEVLADDWMARYGLLPFLNRHRAHLFPGQELNDLGLRAGVLYAESLTAFAGGNLNFELDASGTPLQIITHAGHPHPQQRWTIVWYGLINKALPAGWKN